MRQTGYCESHILMVVAHRSWKRLWHVRHELFCTDCERTVIDPAWLGGLSWCMHLKRPSGLVLALWIYGLALFGLVVYALVTG